jgi:uncharacterized damage-inducible protein DinB
MYSIHKHLQYNLWANGKIVEILTNTEERFLDLEVKSSFPSVKKTVLHIWDAEQIWFTRIQGGVMQGWPSENFKGGKEELLKAFLEQSQKYVDFFADKDNSFIEGSIHYKNMKGVEFTNKLEDILFHVVNHGTFHRGQIITMLRELGFDSFPVQDLIAFARLG